MAQPPPLVMLRLPHSSLGLISLWIVPTLSLGLGQPASLRPHNFSRNQAATLVMLR